MKLLQGHSMAIVHATAMFRSDMLKSVGYREKYKFIEDLDLFLRLALRGGLANLEEVLYSYRQHPAGTNAMKSKEQQNLKQEILEEAHLMRNLSPPTGRIEMESLKLSDLYADWSCKAFMGRNRATGWYYAVRYLFAGRVSYKKVRRFGQIVRFGSGRKSAEGAGGNQ